MVRPGQVDEGLAADFLALGLGYLLVELLTRQMRYMSNIDEIHLRNEAVSAARAAVDGQADTARDHLRNCFDVLTEARERFYPVEAYLVDLVLVAPTTLGSSLRRELADGGAKNLLISGELVEQLASAEPETLAALRLALDHGTVSLVGGEFDERELPLLPIESTLADLRRGSATYHERLGSACVVYGRRRFGLSPVLPQILSRLGYQGAPYHAGRRPVSQRGPKQDPLGGARFQRHRRVGPFAARRQGAGELVGVSTQNGRGDGP